MVIRKLSFYHFHFFLFSFFFFLNLSASAENEEVLQELHFCLAVTHSCMVTACKETRKILRNVTACTPVILDAGT